MAVGVIEIPKGREVPHVSPEEVVWAHRMLTECKESKQGPLLEEPRVGVGERNLSLTPNGFSNGHKERTGHQRPAGEGAGSREGGNLCATAGLRLRLGFWGEVLSHLRHCPPELALSQDIITLWADWLTPPFRLSYKYTHQIG